MVENINEFLSIAVLFIFLFVMLIALVNKLNKRKIRKHIEEEYYYYQDNDESDF